MQGLRWAVAAATALLLAACTRTFVHAHGGGGPDVRHAKLDPRDVAAHDRPYRSLHDFDVLTDANVRLHNFSARRSLHARFQQSQPLPDAFVIEIDAFDARITFDMTINEHIFNPSAVVRYWDENGNYVQRKPTNHYYKGTAVSSSLGSGWARLTVIPGSSPDSFVITGSFTLDGVLYEINTPTQFSKKATEVTDNARHKRRRSLESDVRSVVYRASDLQVHDASRYTCGVTDELLQVQSEAMFMVPPSDFSGAEAAGLHARVDSGCPTSRKIVYVKMFADQNYLAYHSTSANVITQMISNVNQATTVYEQEYNVIIGLWEVEVMNSTNPLDFNQVCSSAYTITDRLSDFSQYRGTQTQDPSGLFHLMSNCPTLPTVGIAWLNLLCTTAAYAQSSSTGTQYVSGCAVSTITDEEWLVVAHEMGHNFGSLHDCTSTSCSPVTNCNPCTPDCDCQGAYIMNPTSSSGPSSFSPSTQSQICTKVASTGTCLETPGTETILNSGICGNGIQEPPEQCDCGAANSDTCIYSRCCNGTTCMLLPNAVCNNDTNNPCCDGESCNLIPSQRYKVCRPIANPDCDLAEHCDGNYASCPPDRFQPDGVTLCTSPLPDITPTNVTYCASGQCTSRQIQCYNQALANGQTGFTQDCAEFSGTCQVFCTSALESCAFFYGTFSNGTKCGDNGYCYGGECTQPDFVAQTLTFVQNNVVMVAVGGGIVVLMLGSLIYLGCQSAGKKKLTPEQAARARNTRSSSSRPSDSSGHSHQSSGASPRPQRPSGAPSPQQQRPSGAASPHQQRPSGATPLQPPRTSMEMKPMGGDSFPMVAANTTVRRQPTGRGNVAHRDGGAVSDLSPALAIERRSQQPHRPGPLTAKRLRLPQTLSSQLHVQ